MQKHPGKGQIVKEEHYLKALEGLSDENKGIFPNESDATSDEAISMS